MTKKIDTPSLVEIVRERIIEDIMEHRYRPGQKLPVSELTERYGVSETPIKQAFNRLVAEGMLVALPRRGVIVRSASKDEIRELMEARHYINLVSVDAAIECMQSNSCRLVEEIHENTRAHAQLIEDMGSNLSIDMFLRYVEIDRMYHLAYLSCTGNRIIYRFFWQLHTQTSPFINLSEPMRERIVQAHDEHRRIFEACVSGNRLRMIDELEHHKVGAVESMRLQLAEEFDDEQVSQPSD